MKKEWEKPKLEILNVNLTMAGPGRRLPDAIQPDPDDPVKFS
ncbi:MULTISPECIES: paeninodin family lasso peptide [Bacillaceae]|nr:MULTISPECIES: paeninodin family lasso peptide [unclassified Bacillus (in: firmicutes)]MBT2616223.1 paeninodin family lasso peptide [Bacillus sp. ISL-78]MBT2628999.1 paeninodin family lasso peptide [Bacillus sp. ISL-101]MBT2714946.1 paeninodin family lasso peptide [Bacillus sp. ISL-57]TDL92312.1 paeninodin family lasso peptide [Vibrio vulnificus]